MTAAESGRPPNSRADWEGKDALDTRWWMAEDTMIAVDGGVPVLPRRQPAVTVP